MSGLASLVFNAELSLTIAIVTSFVLAFLLFLINVPSSEHSRKLIKAKNTIAMCFFISSILFFVCYTYSGITDFEVFSSLMMFVVTAISSAILSFSLMNLLEEGDNDKFFLNVTIIAIFSCILMRSFWMERGAMRWAILIGSIVLYVANCIIHIVLFHRTYLRSVQKLEQYYDEEENNKMKWIRFCYIMMMLTQMFVLVYMLLPRGFMKIYTLWYVLFMVYFSANFISFLGSNKLLLDAFAYKTLSGQEIMERIERRKRMKKGAKEAQPLDSQATEQELNRIEHALDKWVKEKRYREYDKTREQIAKELNTSKEMLHLFFVTRMSVDFKTWRTRLRIEEAKLLLLENQEMSINIVAELSGFSDRSNFHRQFTKIVGCSPKQWRESAGK
ncbi:MAG: helix-turn-helix domain-containing protein [Bacteroidales bacterium]|nr:helix-turn-helix domain-containing protein [Bacteroidales bacterium]